MHNFVQRQVALIWIAMLAVLFSALAPTIAHAMAATQQPTPAMQICTADRSQAGFLALVAEQAAASKAPSNTDTHIVEHCPYCATHGSMLMPPPGAPSVLALPALAAAYPTLFYQSSTPLFSWNACRARAPPAPR